MSSISDGVQVKSPTIKIIINHNDTIQQPSVEDDVQITWERKSSAGKLTFTTRSSLSFGEGDPVAFYYDGVAVFAGYVFKKSRDKRTSKIQVTCYDQLRYLKNKYCFVYTKKKASEIVKSLCSDYKLTTGTIEDSGYVISSLTEENKEALDVALEASEETLTNTGKLFILYDDAGKICYRNALNLKLNTLIDSTAAQDLTYETSIDDETYNRVILYYKPSTDTSSTNSTSSSKESGSTIVAGGTSTTGSTSTSSTAAANLQKIINVESAEVGNSYSYYNKFNASISVNGCAWCCSFQSWAFKQAGLSNYIMLTASVYKMYEYFHNKGCIVKSPKAGDLVIFSNYSHIGLVVSVSGGYIHTIEGNTSGGVHKRTYGVNVSKIYAYCRPQCFV